MHTSLDSRAYTGTTSRPNVAETTVITPAFRRSAGCTGFARRLYRPSSLVLLPLRALLLPLR